jgi:hypothetical protein
LVIAHDEVVTALVELVDVEPRDGRTRHSPHLAGEDAVPQPLAARISSTPAATTTL